MFTYLHYTIRQKNTGKNAAVVEGGGRRRRSREKKRQNELKVGSR